MEIAVSLLWKWQRVAIWLLKKTNSWKSHKRKTNRNGREEETILKDVDLTP